MKKQNQTPSLYSGSRVVILSLKPTSLPADNNRFFFFLLVGDIHIFLSECRTGQDLRCLQDFPSLPTPLWVIPKKTMHDVLNSYFLFSSLNEEESEKIVNAVVL